MSEFTVGQFGGLDLRTDAQDAGPQTALNIFNVRVDNPSKLETRQGYVARNTDTTWTISTTTASYGAPIGMAATRKVGAESYYILDAASTVKKVNPITWATDGVARSSTLHVTSILSIGDDVLLGASDSQPLTPVFTGINANKLIGIGAGPYSTGLSYWSRQARVISIGGAIGVLNAQRVHFSGPNSFTTWGTDDWIDLDVTDGGALTGVCAWGDIAVVSKLDKFYVFYEVGVDSEGGAQFLYRTVANGVGAISQRLMCAGRDGIYFVAPDGVYVTTGGEPTLISGAIQRYFDGRPGEFASSLNTFGGACELSASSTALYLLDTTHTMVYYFASGQWSVYSHRDAPLAMLHLPSTTDHWLFADFNCKVYESASGFSDDAGFAFTWIHRGAWTDMEMAEQEKVLRESYVTGTGNVKLTRLRDYQATDTNEATLALGSQQSTGRHRKAWRGTRLSTVLSGSGQASVAGYTHEVSSTRPAGAKGS